MTRKAVVAILTGIEKAVFEQFKFNPEEFIIKAAALINDEKATAIIQHITYNVLDEHYDTDIFTEPTIKGKLGTNAMKAQRHLYDHIVYDSTNERDFCDRSGHQHRCCGLCKAAGQLLYRNAGRTL